MKRVIDSLCSNCAHRYIARDEYRKWLESEPKDYSNPDYIIEHENWELEEPIENPCVHCTLNNIG